MNMQKTTEKKIQYEDLYEKLGEILGEIDYRFQEGVIISAENQDKMIERCLTIIDYVKEMEVR